MRKSKNRYASDDLSGDYFTTIDIMEVCDLSEVQAMELMKYLKQLGVGEIYTQVDGDYGKPNCVYSKGIKKVNRTGVYAFVFR